MRNGIIADTLRNAGSPFRIIFGLNLPQLVEIAGECGKSTELAELLWQNNSTRESMLLAPMLVEEQHFTLNDSLRWIDSIPSAEVADILCHRLLRKVPYAWTLAEQLISTPSGTWHQYTGLRLTFNLINQDPQRAIDMLQNSDIQDDLLPLSNSIISECRYLTSNL